MRTELDGEIYCSPIYVTNEGKEEIKRIILKYKDDGYDFTYDPNAKKKLLSFDLYKENIHM